MLYLYNDCIGAGNWVVTWKKNLNVDLIARDIHLRQFIITYALSYNFNLVDIIHRGQSVNISTYSTIIFNNII